MFSAPIVSYFMFCFFSYQARARLANTKGKKAKRKAREKALEEARRLASLQKRRELKAAGIEIRRFKKKRRNVIDYNEEIPFEKVPARGYFDVGEERKRTLDMRNDPRFLGKDIQEIDGKRRDYEEAIERKKDAKREALFRKADLPGALKKINQLNDPELISRRTALVLPAPMVDDNELEDIAKLGSMAAPSALSGPTKTLVGRYDTPARTPQRTPARTPLVRDTILEETQNLIAMNSQQSVLLGGENAKLHATDFRKLTREQTPNRLPTGATPTPGRGGIGMTPGRTPNVSGTPVRNTPGSTPVRDQLSINDPSALNLSAEQAIQANSFRVQKRKRQELQGKLSMDFGALPAPQMEYSLVLPDLPSTDELKNLVTLEEDAEGSQMETTLSSDPA